MNTYTKLVRSKQIINDIMAYRQTNFARNLTLIMGLMTFLSGCLAHFKMLDFPREKIESCLIVGLVQNAWFTAVIFASTCAIIESLSDALPIQFELKSSPLVATYETASRLEFMYPFLSAYAWFFYEPDHTFIFYFSTMAIFIRLLCDGDPWMDWIGVGFYCIVAFLHGYICFVAGNYFGLLGAFIMILTFTNRTFGVRPFSQILCIEDTYEFLVCMSFAVICFGCAYWSMAMQPYPFKITQVL